MFVMSMLDRLTDVKKSTYAKIIAVLVSVAMVLSLTNMPAFAEGDGLSGIFGGNSDVVKVAVDLDNAKIEYGDQTVTNADKTFVASAGKDLKFKASAVTEDFTLDEVALVTTAENGDEVETDLESIDGTYTIKADDVADGITIKASATEQKTAAKDSTVITDNQSGDEVAGTETTEPGTTDDGTPENGTPEEPSTETPAAGTPESTTPEGTPAGTVAEPSTETPAGTTTPAAEPVENVVTDNVANTVRSSVVSFAKAFTANTGIETYAAEPMADSTYTVVIGKNITITGNGKWNHYHEWSSSDPSVVTVSGNGNKATVTAKKTGTVTIYHYYGVWGYETFTVNVVDSTTTVYVYVKLSGSDTSWTVNKDGWFTIGSIEIPTSVLKQAKDEKAGYYADSIDINKTFDFKTLVRHSDNANIALDFSKIDWTTPRGDQKYGLHVVKDGASGYSVSGHQWHLDGYLDITQKHSANVTYSYANEAEGIANKPNLPTNISQQDLASGTKVEFEVPEITGYAPEIKCDGKTVTDLEKNENGKYCITIVNSDVNVEVIYHPCTYPYTVKYLEQGTNKELHAPATVAGNLYNAQVTVNAIDIAGYNKVNPASSTITISEGNNEITFYYTKRTDLSYTINYLEGVQGEDGKWSAAEGVAPLKEAETVTGTPENPIAVGQNVQAYPADIPGYLPVNEDQAVGITISATNDNVINIYYTKRTDLSYTVNYYFDNVLGDAPEGATTGGNAVYLEEVVIDPASSVTVGENTYTLTSTEHKIDSISADESKNVINVYYELDNVVDPGEDPDPTQPGDGVPDKYQATVLFTTADETQGIVGGDTTKVYTLRDAAGNLVESADVNVTADGVITTAAEGYVFFNWTGAEFGAQTLQGNQVVTFVANWAEDTVGTDPANPDQGDGIPDMYQALVQYVAVNGSINIDHAYVTLFDENGQPAENGTGYLTAEQIAVATAAEGYDQDSLAWDVVPTTENAITGEVTYTVTFTANQTPGVVPGPGAGGGTTPTPAPAGPVPGAAPAALAPVAAALAAPVAALIGDEPTPLAEEAIGDEEDPLAAFDHVNCWVHYYMILGILLTLVYGGCVIARRSNYSRKIQKMDDYATGKAMDTVEETENVANAAAQKMEA